MLDRPTARPIGADADARTLQRRRIAFALLVAATMGSLLCLAMVAV
ncbi:MAG: hypothetical protein QOH98_1441, partial [Methylobacteriaceae bacterium]|nr:hypothetical protein [Methylobacteriaceae bacterium]